jgi:hypothetical protein
VQTVGLGIKLPPDADCCEALRAGAVRHPVRLGQVAWAAGRDVVVRRVPAPGRFGNYVVPSDGLDREHALAVVAPEWVAFVLTPKTALASHA